MAEYTVHISFLDVNSQLVYLQRSFVQSSCARRDGQFVELSFSSGDHLVTSNFGRVLLSCTSTADPSKSVVFNAYFDLSVPMNDHEARIVLCHPALPSSLCLRFFRPTVASYWALMFMGVQLPAPSHQPDSPENGKHPVQGREQLVSQQLDGPNQHLDGLRQHSDGHHQHSDGPHHHLDGPHHHLDGPHRHPDAPHLQATYNYQHHSQLANQNHLDNNAGVGQQEAPHTSMPGVRFTGQPNSPMETQNGPGGHDAFSPNSNPHNLETFATKPSTQFLHRGEPVRQNLMTTNGPRRQPTSSQFPLSGLPLKVGGTTTPETGNDKPLHHEPTPTGKTATGERHHFFATVEEMFQLARQQSGLPERATAKTLGGSPTTSPASPSHVTLRVDDPAIISSRVSKLKCDLNNHFDEKDTMARENTHLSSHQPDTQNRDRGPRAQESWVAGDSAAPAPQIGSQHVSYAFRPSRPGHEQPAQHSREEHQRTNTGPEESPQGFPHQYRHHPNPNHQHPGYHQPQHPGHHQPQHPGHEQSQHHSHQQSQHHGHQQSQHHGHQQSQHHGHQQSQHPGHRHQLPNRNHQQQHFNASAEHNGQQDATHNPHHHVPHGITQEEPSVGNYQGEIMYVPHLHHQQTGMVMPAPQVHGQFLGSPMIYPQHMQVISGVTTHDLVARTPSPCVEGTLVGRRESANFERVIPGNNGASFSDSPLVAPSSMREQQYLGGYGGARDADNGFADVHCPDMLHNFLDTNGVYANPKLVQAATSSADSVSSAAVDTNASGPSWHQAGLVGCANLWELLHRVDACGEALVNVFNGSVSIGHKTRVQQLLNSAFGDEDDNGNVDNQHQAATEDEEASVSKKELMWKVLRQLDGFLAHLMVDRFGNYIVADLFEFCDAAQKLHFVQEIQSSIPAIARNAHGTFALQRMMENLGDEEQLNRCIVDGLAADSQFLARDKLGVFVLCKCLQTGENLSRVMMEMMAKTCVSEFASLAMDKNGYKFLVELMRCEVEGGSELVNDLMNLLTRTHMFRILATHPVGVAFLEKILDRQRFDERTDRCEKLRSMVCEGAFSRLLQDLGDVLVVLRGQFGMRLFELLVESQGTREQLEKMLTGRSTKRMGNQEALDGDDGVRHVWQEARMKEEHAELLRSIVNDAKGRHLVEMVIEAGSPTKQRRVWGTQILDLLAMGRIPMCPEQEQSRFEDKVLRAVSEELRQEEAGANQVGESERVGGFGRVDECGRSDEKESGLVSACESGQSSACESVAKPHASHPLAAPSDHPSTDEESKSDGSPSESAPPANPLAKKSKRHGKRITRRGANKENYKGAAVQQS